MKRFVVDRAALGQNIEILKSRAGTATVFGVIKGNGYGLGVTTLAGVLREHGVDHFTVTDPEEVVRLRQGGFEQETVLMMEGTCNPQELGLLIENRAIVTVGSFACAERLDAEAKARGVVAEAHIKIDTGMGRFGFLPEELQQVLSLYESFPNIHFSGIYTHFCRAFDPKATKEMFERFQSVVKAVAAAGQNPGTVHCCNSTAFWNYPEMHCDAVRIGSALLGRVNFSGETGLTRIGRCEAELEEIRVLPEGHPVGYGSRWVARRETRTAVLPVGYSHGFSVEKGFDIWSAEDCLRGVGRYVKAFLKKKALYVTVNGKPCRVLGHVGMINMVIDVTDCDAQLGDIAVVDINPLVLKGVPVVLS